MDVHASLRHLRMAPRKVRLVVDLIRGISVEEAEKRLNFLKKDAARPVLKLLQSAIANAEHNFKLERSRLMVKTIAVDAGTTLKRFRPRAMGRSAPIRKRTSHITLIVAPADEMPISKKAARRAIVAAGRTRRVKKTVVPVAKPSVDNAPSSKE